MAGKLLPKKQAASRAHPFTSILGQERVGHLRASQPWEAARVQCGVSLPEAKLIPWLNLTVPIPCQLAKVQRGLQSQEGSGW